MIKIEIPSSQLKKALNNLPSREKQKLRGFFRPTAQEARKIILGMPIEEKLKLLEELEKETWTKRLDKILHNIDKRRRKLKITDRELLQEIENGRQAFHDRHR